MDEEREVQRKIVQEVSGFYPIFEALLERYNDLITPAVFGIAWRYCQMEDGVCRASLRKIAGILNISEATVMRRLEDLCNDGYLIDTTPDLRNSPHIYVDAGLVIMRSTLGVVETVSHRNSTKSVSERKATVSQGKATVSESQLIKDINKDSNKGMPAPAFDFSNMTVPQAYKVPTLKMFNRATGWLPADILWEQVHNFILDNNLTEEQIKSACIAWVGKGYNRRNVMGILEWAKNGTTGEYQQQQKPTSAPAVDEVRVQQTQQMLAEKLNGNFVPRPAHIERPRIGKAG